jgi:hypothetical protein
MNDWRGDMNSITRSPNRVRLGALLALLAFLASTSGLAADDCERVEDDGTVRECTYLEELGECIDVASEERAECRDAADGFWEKLGCDVTWLGESVVCVIVITSDWLL